MIDTTEVRKILQGKTVFVGDVLDSKAYWVKAKRSTVAHGFITGFVFPPLPETVQVIRLRDIPGKPAVTLGKEEVPLLNETEVRYIGEPILLLIGPNIETLEELIDQIVLQISVFLIIPKSPLRLFWKKLLYRGILTLLFPGHPRF
jgi:xanthine dehydrogenase molybdopterin-binding subunit B